MDDDAISILANNSQNKLNSDIKIIFLSRTFVCCISWKGDKKYEENKKKINRLIFLVALNRINDTLRQKPLTLYTRVADLKNKLKGTKCCASIAELGIIRLNAHNISCVEENKNPRAN